jgi:CHAD domain-containing protein
VAVRDALTRVLAGVADEPERVHKLRVATRRATAAVDGFSVCLSERVVKRTKKRLRTLRHTAGAARDWDVFFAATFTWASEQPESTRPGLDLLLGWAAAQRHTAQAALESLGEDHPNRINCLLSHTVSAVSRTSITMPDLARQKLMVLLHELTDSTSHEPADDAQLHRVRIVGKRVRYAAEVFSSWLPVGFCDQLTPAIKGLQDSLGRFNDAVVAARHLNEFARHIATFHPVEWERFRAGVELFAAHQTSRRTAEQQAFLDWRTRWLAADGAPRLIELLERAEIR